MDCRADSSEKLPLLHAESGQQRTESLLPTLPEEILVMILHRLPLKAVTNLARASKAMNTRVNDARSIYTEEPRKDNIKPDYLTYRQVTDVLRKRTAARKRIAEIKKYNDASCYYIPPEDRQCTQATEGIAIIAGGIIALMSGSVSLILSLSTPIMWPLIVCGTGSTAAACPIGLGAVSRFYTNRFDREDKEVAELTTLLDENNLLENSINAETQPASTLTMIR